MTDNSADTFPGWYPDPRGEADQRFWNGRDWTAKTRTSVPDAQVVPAPGDDTGSVKEAAPATPKRVDADHSSNGASTGEAEPGRARIFGGPPAGGTVATKDAPETEGAKVKAVEPVAEPVSKAPAVAKAEVASAKAEATPAKDTSLFGNSNGSVSDRSKSAGAETAPKAKILDPDKELTARIDNDPILQKTANRPAITPVVPTPAPAPIAGKLIGAGLVSLLIGGLIGWAIGRSGDESSTTAASETTVTTIDEQTDTGSAGTEVEETDEATAELQTTVDDLNSELEAAGAEVDALALERDNAIEHNEILQTWFTPEVRANSERAWELGVQQACGAEADPTIENTNYTRAMELIGTHADLVTAALVCRSEG